MGNVSITRWQCDRCGALEQRKPGSLIGQHQVNVTKMIGSEVFGVIDWTDLCHSCVSVVDDQIEAIIESAKVARTASADKRMIQL